MVEDKVIIVTGGGSGIGRATCDTLARNGAKVIVADLDAASAHVAAEAITAEGGVATAVKVDVADEASVEAMVAFAVATYGKLDGAVNNAGIEMSNKPVHELSAEEWRRVIDVDLSGVFFCVKHEVREMKKNGGAIVNTSSGAGLRGQINAVDYVAAKHGVQGITKAVATEVGAFGIRINSVNPGLIMTPMVRDRLMHDPVFDKALDGLRQRHHIGRFGEVQEVANAIMWLLSGQSSFVTGAPLLVDGGYCV
ncbi:SDR family NAD(P)-dependent oxidoreductase [Novosphingobium colocasiae]|uniref:Short chain dehydrogenase n=1 Tax=Novosphingobium colocasiae TaxID=1256513 RepID=A0A918UKH3_9SPHN|nr:glucose 1-dehydrogenase [Novosphingobium colocasiae]GGZ16906.1 short chain dehydrogenase [Novosphingobium colocasiae]